MELITKKRIFLIGILAGLTVVVLITPSLYQKSQSVSKLCSVCHEMRPEYVTWQVSSHSAVPCSGCHVSNEKKSMLSFYSGVLKRLGKHFSGGYLLPITLNKAVSNKLCLNCHNPNRIVSPGGDLKIPHSSHIKRNIPCGQCHSGITHGNIANKQETIDGNFARWNTQYVKARISRNINGLSMENCTECHNHKKVANSCETCHKELIRPDDHKNRAWISIHGLEARKNIEGCDKCHSITMTFESSHAADSAVSYARTNSFCYQCHLKRPVNHGTDWLQIHGQKSPFRRENCLICHNRTQPLASERTAKTYCMKCHKQAHRYFNKDTHPIKFNSKAIINLQCFSCHSKKKCNVCHDIPITEEVGKDVSTVTDKGV